MKKHIPNLLTLANLFMGCLALVFIFNKDLTAAALCTAACFLFDYADGFVARALGVSGPLGKELDSLADVVSFAVVPGAIFFVLLQNLLSSNPLLGQTEVPYPHLAAVPAFILSASGAMRLAKFNLDTRQTDYFLGLSTPACTLFVLGLGLSLGNPKFPWLESLHSVWVIYGLIGMLSWLMLSEIPLLGMKIKLTDKKSNLITLGGGLIGLGLFATFGTLALSLNVILYIVLSLFLLSK